MNDVTPSFDSGGRQYLGFRVAGEEYGIPILKVREIIEYGAITRVPSTPPFVRGVINLRGVVVPVVDLAVKFGLSESAVTRRSCIVVVEIPYGESPLAMGVMIDEVCSVLEIADANVEPAPDFGSSVRPEFLRGMGTLANHRLVMLLDIDAVLGDPSLAAPIASAA